MPFSHARSALSTGIITDEILTKHVDHFSFPTQYLTFYPSQISGSTEFTILKNANYKVFYDALLFTTSFSKYQLRIS